MGHCLRKRASPRRRVSLRRRVRPAARAACVQPPRAVHTTRHAGQFLRERASNRVPRSARHGVGFLDLRRRRLMSVRFSLTPPFSLYSEITDPMCAESVALGADGATCPDGLGLRGGVPVKPPSAARPADPRDARPPVNPVVRDVPMCMSPFAGALIALVSEPDRLSLYWNALQIQTFVYSAVIYGAEVWDSGACV